MIETSHYVLHVAFNIWNKCVQKTKWNVINRKFNIFAEFILLIHEYKKKNVFLPIFQLISDTIPVRNGTYSPSCAMQKSCACNNSKCFYGNPCICERNFNPCEVGEEMNSRGGKSIDEWMIY